jgi:hypothetical protein
MTLLLIFAVLFIVAMVALFLPPKTLKVTRLESACPKCKHPLYMHGEYDKMTCAHTHQVSDTAEVRDCNCTLTRWDIAAGNG